MKTEFKSLEEMIYSGRGITVGMTPNGNTFVGYTITGRSPSSKSRKLIYDKETHTIRTDVIDESVLQKGSPALLLYPAVTFVNNAIVASNGAQTKLLYSSIKRHSENSDISMIMKDAFCRSIHEYDEKDKRWIDLAEQEPDAPNYTPRISAIVRGDVAVLRLQQEKKKRKPFWKKLQPGEAWTLTTYNGGNENPLKPFTHSDLLRGQVGTNDPKAINFYLSQTLYKDGKEDYRVASAVMLINYDRNISTSIINNNWRQIY
ncbi:MAG: IMP cyclohydrolase [Candidatus Woesearchaeota archaeon]